MKPKFKKGDYLVKNNVGNIGAFMGRLRDRDIKVIAVNKYNYLIQIEGVNRILSPCIKWVENNFELVIKKVRPFTNVNNPELKIYFCEILWSSRTAISGNTGQLKKFVKHGYLFDYGYRVVEVDEAGKPVETFNSMKDFYNSLSDDLTEAKNNCLLTKISF